LPVGPTLIRQTVGLKSVPRRVGLVTLFSLPLTFVAVAVASTVSPAATVGVLALTLVGAAYVVGSSALGGYLADRVSAGEKLPWSTDDSTVSETPIDRLKHQYVDGELTDAEFERRLERLVDADRERERVEAGPTTDSKAAIGRQTTNASRLTANAESILSEVDLFIQSPPQVRTSL